MLTFVHLHPWLNPCLHPMASWRLNRKPVTEIGNTWWLELSAWAQNVKCCFFSPGARQRAIALTRWSNLLFVVMPQRFPSAVCSDWQAEGRISLNFKFKLLNLWNRFSCADECCDKSISWKFKCCVPVIYSHLSLLLKGSLRNAWMPDVGTVKMSVHYI